MYMDNTRRQPSDVGSSRSSFPVKLNAPHFFKIITPLVAQQRKLKIPRKFMIRYGKNLANLVFLSVPSGAIWRVELLSSNEDAWLCNGWEQFAEFYSVSLWYFLAFRYDGKSNFHVLIFDMSATEIEYPISATHGDQQANINNNGNSQEPETDVEVDDSVEILKDFQTYQTRREEIPKRKEIVEDVSIEILDGPPVSSDLFPTRETVRTNVTCKMESTSNLQTLLESRGIQTVELKLPNPKTDVEPHCLTQEIKEKCTGAAFQIPSRKKSATPNVEFRALQRARDFKSENPFFRVSMQPSHVDRKRRGTLYVPKDFAQKYLRGVDAVLLQVSDGKTWFVKCYHESSDKCRLGWISFVRDNNLKVGDVCVFEVIKSIEPHMNVIIFRAVEYGLLKEEFVDQQGNINDNGNLQEPETNVEVVDSVEILEDFQTYQTRREEIPEREEIEEDVSIEILDTPPVANFLPSSETVRTNVKCKMESTFNLQTLLDVKPHCLTQEIRKECTGGASEIPTRKQLATPDVKFTALQRARDFKSESPFFTIFMKSSYVYGSVTLYIPRDFAQKYLWGENVILRVSEGRTWSVKLYRATSGDQFSLGWVSFVRDNNLKVGDACVFELIKGVEPCLNVIIFRAIKECTRGMFQVPAGKESATPNVEFRALQ